MFQKYYSWKKSQIKKGSKTLQILPKAATHLTKYGKQTAKKPKKNVEKKKENSIEIDNQENHSDTSVIEDDSEINERYLDFQKDKVKLKDEFGKERENSNKIDGKNQLPTINKECKGDVKERSCSTVDKRIKIRFEKIKYEMKNIFMGKGKKEKKRITNKN